MKRNQNRPNRKRIRLVLTIVIVVLLIAVVGVVSVMRCLEFDENGAHVIDRYGVLAMEAGSGMPAEEQQTDSERGGGDTAGSGESQDKQEAELRAVMLSSDVLTDSDALDRIETFAQDGVLDTVIVNIKDNDGVLNIAVDTDELEDSEYITNDNADSIQDGIKQLADAGITVIGRICSFHDQYATARNSDLAMQFENGGTWLDYDKTRWLDPTNYDAVRYLCDVAAAARDAGCSEILLADFNFPPRGHLDRVEFDSYPDDQASTLLDAFHEIQNEVSELPVSIEGSVEELTQLSENGTEDGIELGDVSTLLSAVHRLYVTTEDAKDLKKEWKDATDVTADIIIPVLDSHSDWADYGGTAAWNARSDGEDALDMLEE